MRFGPQYEQQKIPEWASKYIRYVYLLKMLKPLYRPSSREQEAGVPLLPINTNPDSGTPTLDEWVQTLKADCEKVHHFFDQKYSEYTSELDDIIDFVNLNLAAGTDLMLTDHPDPRQRLPSLQRAIQNSHRALWTLEVYVEVNQLALRRLIMKLRKVAMEDARLAEVVAMLCDTLYPLRKQTHQARKRIYEFTAEHITHRSLRATKEFFHHAEITYKQTDIAIICFCSGVLFICVTAAITMITELSSLSQIVPSFCIYRMIASFTFTLWMAGMILFLFEYHSINWTYIFELKQKSAISFIKIMKTASIWSAIWGMMFLAHIMYRLRDDTPKSDYISLMAFIAFLGVWFIPLHVMYLTIRKELLFVVLQIVAAPFGKVEFVHFYTGDVVTSLSKPLGDLYRSFCFITSGAWAHMENGNCANQNYGLYLMSVLPYWWRFLQCLNRFYVTKQWFPHLVNAGKYASGLIAISLSYFPVSSDPHTSLFIYVIVYVVATVYLFTWDILMDFGFRRFFKPEGRRKRLFPRWYYYYIFISNLLLRYAWFITVMPSSMLTNPYLQVELILLIASLLEIFRRGQWTLFRVENEKFSNIEKYRHVDFVPKLPKVIIDEL